MNNDVRDALVAPSSGTDRVKSGNYSDSKAGTSTEKSSHNCFCLFLPLFCFFLRRDQK